MADFLLDTFTTAATTPLGSHAPETGGTWIDGFSTGAGSANVNTSGLLVGVNAAHIWYNNVAPSGADYTISVGLNKGGLPAIVGRYSPTTQNYYALFFQANSTYIEKKVGGVTSKIATSAAVSTGAHTASLQFVGSRIIAVVDGTQVMAVDDTSIAAAGFVGVYIGNSVQFDQISATVPSANIVSGSGMAAGISDTATISQKTVAAKATADGSAATNIDGVRAFTTTSTGTSVGKAQTSVTGKPLLTAYGNAAGAATVQGEATTLQTKVGVFTSQGSSTSAVRGTGLRPASFSVAGGAVTDGQTVALGVGEAEGVSEGSSQATAVGVVVRVARGLASGSASGTLVGSVSRTGVAMAAGGSIASGINKTPQIAEGSFTAAGVATVSIVSVTPVSASGISVGRATTTMIGRRIGSGVGSAAGITIVTAISQTVTFSEAFASGSSTSNFAFIVPPKVGTSIGAATVSGVGRAISEAVGSAVAQADAEADGQMVLPSVATAIGTSKVKAYYVVERDTPAERTILLAQALRFVSVTAVIREVTIEGGLNDRIIIVEPIANILATPAAERIIVVPADAGRTLAIPVDAPRLVAAV